MTSTGTTFTPTFCRICEPLCPLVAETDGDGTVRHSWSSELLFAPTDPGQDARHLGTLEPMWNLFDLTPEGRPAGWDEQLSYDP